MQEASENAHANTPNVKFIDMLIGQWTKRTGNDPHQAQEVTENVSTQENAQHTVQKRERIIQDLRRKLKESQEEAAFLSTSLESETRNKEEIRMKLNATWESIQTITEYFNYISEILAICQQQRVILSSTYDNVILKQQETIQKLQSSNVKSKDLEDRVTQLKNALTLREERLQEAMMEQNKIYKQLENSEYELQSQKNELNTYTKEKLTLVQEQQRLILENENLKSQLQITEKEKCDIAKSAAQLENKLLLQEEKMQYISTETNKLQKQVENAEHEFHSQKSNLTRAHAEEKKILVEEQERLLSEIESLQSRMNMLEQDKSNITETIVQKDTLLSKLQDEILTYKNEMEMMRTNYNEVNTKYEILTEKQIMWEKESCAKTEKIQTLEAVLSAIKQRENKFINDVNRMEKKLTNEVNYSKDLANKLSKAQENLQSAQKKNVEIQNILEITKSTGELTNTELEQQLKVLQKEKEEIIKRENMKIKNTEILYENAQAKHAEEVSALKSNYESQLLELKKTTDSLNNMINNVRKENTALNKSLIKIRTENSELKHEYKLIMQRNEDLQEKLKATTEASQMKSIEHRKSKSEFTMSQPNIFTFTDDEKDEPSPPIFAYSMNISTSKENQKEQEAEVTSAGRKFFKSRSGQPRTYTKRR
ncbi:uncharacterized protein [Anoplolepis gracilipes]|uniref:uncharacterized protein isoform X2 n=1 Tax=Anoplolepis gracilipes TaxID=354296 RepID=UPI003BA0887C